MWSSADDDVVIELGQLFLEQVKGIARQDKQVCYEYSSGVTNRKTFANFIAPELLTRELAIYERVIRTARPRSPANRDIVDALWTRASAKAQRRLGDTFTGLPEGNLTPAQRALYCDFSIALFETILAEDRNAAIILLRDNFKPTGT
jgi:hypothetical protein